jgi:hypothetical protein
MEIGPSGGNRRPIQGSGSHHPEGIVLGRETGVTSSSRATGCACTRALLHNGAVGADQGSRNGVFVNDSAWSASSFARRRVAGREQCS